MTQVLERYRTPILAALVLLLAGAAAVIYFRRPAYEPIEIVDGPSSSDAAPAELAVYVTGAVFEPGVCYLPQGSRVEQALQAAGGPKPEADLDRVNLARRVRDEEQIYVPAVGEESVPAQPGSSSGGDLINLNTATPAELETLPGVGPALAQRIVEHREAQGPFATIEDITAVRGIGEGLFDEIRDLITVQ
jgi:competence protein ComEA